MQSPTTDIRDENGTWVLRLSLGGKTQVFQCATEQMAQQMAANLRRPARATRPTRAH